jgi:hypothetical protein
MVVQSEKKKEEKEWGYQFPCEPTKCTNYSNSDSYVLGEKTRANFAELETAD